MTDIAPADSANDLVLKFDPHTIEHLGSNMYSRLPNAVAELVADLGPAWTLVWDELPAGTYGLTDHLRQRIILQRGMTYEERRCTIAHEVEHARRGPVPTHRIMQEELLIDRKVSRLLLPSLARVCDELMRHDGDYERASSDLSVDVLMLEVRLSALWAREREYLRRRMADLLLVGA